MTQVWSLASPCELGESVVLSGSCYTGPEPKPGARVLVVGDDGEWEASVLALDERGTMWVRALSELRPLSRQD